MSADQGFGIWRAAAASAVGTAHLAEGRGCDDWTACAVALGGRALCAALCDGAGSAPRSAAGARVAAEAFVALARGFLEAGGSLAALDRDLAEHWIDRVREAVETRAEEDGEDDVADYACTLLGVVAFEGRLATFQIGDGAIAVGCGGVWRYVYWPQHGEYANETYFVTDAAASDSLQFDVTELDFDEIGAFTDGLERLLLHHAIKAVHGPFFESMMPSVRAVEPPGVDAALSAALGAYLSSEAVNRRTDDDKSLLLASRRRPTGGG